MASSGQAGAQGRERERERGRQRSLREEIGAREETLFVIAGNEVSFLSFIISYSDGDGCCLPLSSLGYFTSFTSVETDEASEPVIGIHALLHINTYQISSKKKPIELINMFYYSK